MSTLQWNLSDNGGKMVWVDPTGNDPLISYYPELHVNIKSDEDITISIVTHDDDFFPKTEARVHIYRNLADVTHFNVKELNIKQFIEYMISGFGQVPYPSDRSCASLINKVISHYLSKGLAVVK